MKMPEAIKISNFSWKYRYGQDFSLKDINLDIKAGEIIAVTGPSGAGKSTLCLALCGLIPNEIEGELKGSVTVLGKDTAKAKMGEIVKNVAVVFQDPETQFLSSCVRDEVAFGLENWGVAPDEIEKRIEWALKITNMFQHIDKHPLELSGGQKQRVALASALALKPQIIILDEPTSNLDPQGVRDFFQAIEAMRKELGTTIVIVEHNLADLALVADRFVLLDKGVCELVAAPKEFFANENLLNEKGIWTPEVSRLARRLLPDQLEIFLSLETLAPHLEGKKFQVKTLEKNLTKGATILEAHKVCYTYPDGSDALKDVNLMIKEGDFLALIGQNAGGKTTLAKVLAGLNRPESGEVFFKGADLRRFGPSERAYKIGYLFQDPERQLFCDTVEQEVAYGPKNFGLEPSEINSRVCESLALVGIAHHAKAHPLSLVAADRQRVALASVLAMKPEVLILDEPTAGMDRNLTRDLMNLLHQLNRSGTTIVLITHNLSLVAESAQSVTVIGHGSVYLSGSVREILTQKSNHLQEVGLRPLVITELSFMHQNLACLWGASGDEEVGKKEKKARWVKPGL